MNLGLRALARSPWIFHLSTGSCNNCDIEVLDCLTPRFDVERFGMILAPSIRHADVLLVTGSVTKQCAIRLKRMWEQVPQPCLVMAIGACACSQHFYRDSYHMAEPLDQIIPVDVYVPGCPPKPEAILIGAVKAIAKLRGQAPPPGPPPPPKRSEPRAEVRAPVGARAEGAGAESAEGGTA